MPLHPENDFNNKNTSGLQKCCAVILAGGLGTRLRSAVPDMPKCMAPVAGKPFLHYVIQYLQQQGVHQFIFSLGYMHEIIGDWLLKNYPLINYQVSIEDEPLGTGGAIQLALKMANTEQVLVLNGDTMFKIDTSKLLGFHKEKKAACTLALKPMQDFNRYGVVEINEGGRIQSFKEKKHYKKGLINGGVYALDAEQFLAVGLPEKFSFEKDYLEKYIDKIKLFGQVQDEYFIDIGIPEDLEKANEQFDNLKI